MNVSPRDFSFFHVFMLRSFLIEAGLVSKKFFHFLATQLSRLAEVAEFGFEFKERIKE